MKIASNIYALKNCPNQNYFKSSQKVSKTNAYIDNTQNKSQYSNTIRLSFTGNIAKKPNQVLFVTPELTGYFNEIYNSGGMGVVNKEFPESLIAHYGVDARMMIPYHSYDNPMGMLKTVQMSYDKDGKPNFVKDKSGNLVLVNNQPIHDHIFKEVAADYQIPKENKGKEFFVMLGKAKPTASGDQTAYKILEDTGISGFVERIKEDLTGTEKVPYRLFKTQGAKTPTYVMHVPGTASWDHCYNQNGVGIGGGCSGSAPQKAGSGSSYQNGFHSFQDYEYGIFDKAVVDALPKMAEENGEAFNPRGIELSDRHSFIALTDITEASQNGNCNGYWRGLHIDGRFHNPSDGYQGAYRIPMDFFKITATKEDLENLQQTPGYDYVLEMMEKIKQGQEQGKETIEEILTQKELKKLDDIFEPFIGRFRDSEGRYNLCKLAIENKRLNPFTFELGTVSKHFGHEMANPTTPDIARSLTGDLASVRSRDIVNGSTPASLGLDKGGQIGKGILNTGKTEGYTPIPSLPENFSSLTLAEKQKVLDGEIDALYETSQKNKKWLLDVLGEASEETAKGTFKEELSPLEKLFFEKGMVFETKDGKTIRKENPACILGSMSKFEKDDVLLTSWGRGVDQKGYPATLEGFIQYLKSAAPEAQKRHVKLLVGGGGWTEEDLDWQLIKDKVKQIEDLGYKGQVMYVNGWFPNKLIACADYGIFTSRFEPCGITPLETFSAGKLVISHRTGGAPDFVTPFDEAKNNYEVATGFLTKSPYCLTREAIEQSGTLSKEEIEDAIKYVQSFKKDAPLTAAQELDAIRLCYIGKQNGQCVQEAVQLFANEPDKYKHMMKNARKLEVDWHNNSVFNKGMCADEIYLAKVFRVDPKTLKPIGMENNSPMTKLIGDGAMGAYAQTKKIAAQALNKEDVKEIVQSTVDDILNKTKQTVTAPTFKLWEGLGKTGQIATITFGSILGLIGLVKYCDSKEAKLSKNA